METPPKNVEESVELEKIVELEENDELEKNEVNEKSVESENLEQAEILEFHLSKNLVPMLLILIDLSLSLEVPSMIKFSNSSSK